MKSISLQRMTALLAIFLLAACTLYAQIEKITWPKGPMFVNAKVLSNGELEIKPAATSSQRDFDFLVGKWTMHNTKLRSRLTNNHEWFEFESSDENHNILNGIGNTDTYRSNMDGTPFEGLTVRLFDPKTKLWSLYWVASNVGVMDPPVVGSFEGNIGKFFCKDTFQGKPILVVFVWDKTDPDNPVWYQAFSPDNGSTWEWNFTNVSKRVK